MYASIKLLFQYLLIGVLAILPIVMVIQVVLLIKSLIAAGFFQVYGYVDSYAFTLLLLGLTMAGISYIGYTIVQHRNSLIISSVDLLVEKIPLLSTVYRVSKKVISMFSSGGDNANKREVVYIEYPNKGIWVPAYVTNRSGEWYVLFVPTSPNPTSGFTVLVHESNTIKSTLNIEEVSSFIISVGADFPKSDEVIKLPH
jgi:uncharacterized membrane protein